jgi:Dockerin type I domain
MVRVLGMIAAAALAVATPSARADVPFQPLADFGLGCAPSDVNASGVIVGAVRVDRATGGPYVPVIWQTTESVPTELPSVEGGYATAINSNGDIVGTEFQPAGVYGVPVLWTNGERFVLPDLGEGGYAVDLNDAGVIVGSVISKGNYRAARWVNRELELLPIPDFDAGGAVIWSFAQSINSLGVIAGEVRAPSGTPSVALRWDSEGVAAIPSGGLETRGIAIDNLGGIAINGYFDGGATRAAAVVRPDGVVEVLPGGSATTMSRSGLVAGYYYTSSESGVFQIKAVAWPNGVFTPLEMPAGQRYAFPSGAGNNGFVFGSATDGVTGTSVGGFWDVGVEQSSLRAASAAGAPGQTVQLSVESFRASGANVGHSVAARIDGALVAQGVTDSTGRAQLAVTIPSGFTGSKLAVRCTDENGATVLGVIEVQAGCAAIDLNCDGSVNALDLAALLAAWGSSGPADLNGDGAVNSPDIAFLLSGWTG